MKVAFQQLESHLRSNLASIYLVSGEEPLLVGEALESIRKAAREQEFLERNLHVVDRGFRWTELESQSDNMSLFASRRILELRMSSPRPGDAGARVIRSLAENPDPDRIVLIGIMARLDGSVARSAWVRTVEKHGALVEIWPVPRPQLPRWIRERAARAELRIGAGAAELLADRVEGNLLAADQEIRKLAMTSTTRTVSEDEVLASVGDSARFDVFRLTDAIIAGNATRALRILAGLRNEGVQAVLVSWALTREITLLAKLAMAGGDSRELEKIMNRNGVWRRRQAAVRSASGRYSAKELRDLLALAADVDAVVKGAQFGQPWVALTDLVMAALDPRRAALAQGVA